MAARIELIDGFEDYPGLTTAGVGLASYWITSSPWALVAGRVGGQAIQLAGTGSYIAHELEAATQKAIFFAVKPATSVADHEGIIFRLCNGVEANAHFSIGLTTGHKIYVLNAAGTEIGRKTAVGIMLNTWASISLIWKSGDSDGELKIWVNGELIIDITNADLAHSSGPNATRFYLRDFSGGGTASTNNTLFDDVRVDTETNVQIQEGRYFQLTYATDDSIAWTRNTGATNLSAIDEATCDSDTTYNSSNTVGAIDKFTVNALGFNPDKIYAVVLGIASRKEDVATRRTQCFLESGAESFHSADKYETTDYTWQRNILELDPNGNIEWSKSGLEAIKPGYELIE